MKKGIKTANFFRVLIFLIAAIFTAVITTCESPFDNNETELTISLYGGSGRTVIPWPPTDYPGMFEQITFKIALTGGGKTKNITSKGKSTIKTSVSAGYWDVEMKAFWPDANTLYATGFSSADVKAGSKNVCYIAMNKAFIVYNYTITGSGTSFTATRDGTTIISDTTHQEALNTIRDDANGNDCAIQLGPGDGTYLDVGGSYLQFTGSPWGEVTLSGAITCTWNNNAAIGTITIANGTAIIIKSTANIRNTSGSANHRAFVNNSGTATFIMDGGTISSGNATMSGAMRNLYGTIIINGGTVSCSSNNYSTALENDNGGTVTVYGGTIQAAANVNTTSAYYTVKNNNGTVTIYSPPAVITPNETNGNITWIP